MITVQSSSVEQLKLPVFSPQTPAATPPAFAFSAGTIDDTALVFTNGEWVGTWDAVTGLIEALSPSIGGEGATVELENQTTYDVFIRYVYDGDKAPVYHAGTIFVR
jgi:hypothetical protein